MSRCNNQLDTDYPHVSLMLTCRACGVETFAWLRHVLTELPQRPDNADIDDLLPFNFKRQPT